MSQARMAATRYQARNTLTDLTAETVRSKCGTTSAPISPAPPAASADTVRLAAALLIGGDLAVTAEAQRAARCPAGWGPMPGAPFRPSAGW